MTGATLISISKLENWIMFPSWISYCETTQIYLLLWLPKCLRGKEFACHCRRRRFDPWIRKIPWRRKWEPAPVFLPGKSHGQRSLMGYSPWGHEESDVTKPPPPSPSSDPSTNRGREESGQDYPDTDLVFHLMGGAMQGWWAVQRYFLAPGSHCLTLTRSGHKLKRHQQNGMVKKLELKTVRDLFLKHVRQQPGGLRSSWSSWRRGLDFWHVDGSSSALIWVWKVKWWLLAAGEPVFYNQQVHKSSDRRSLRHVELCV